MNYVKSLEMKVAWMSHFHCPMGVAFEAMGRLRFRHYCCCLRPVDFLLSIFPLIFPFHEISLMFLSTCQMDHPHPHFHCPTGVAFGVLGRLRRHHYCYLRPVDFLLSILLSIFLFP